MLLLKAPYGWPDGQNVALKRDATKPMDDDLVRHFLRMHGCPHWIVPKVLSCLRYSGHFECRMAEHTAYSLSYSYWIRQTDITVEVSA